MWHSFYDKDFKHKKCKWWHIVNITTCFDSMGGSCTVYKVYCLRIFNLDICRIGLAT